MNTHLMTPALCPGSFIRLKDQPEDLPDFVLERYLDRFCWIRQQGWGRCVQWKVNVARVQTSPQG
ncbi:MAG: hypothetical protein DCF25_08110 [Leptolyngbya foveolarum]|uniref:Uncharacterized protein n=1 Tax=Leptolyngbya foveolarum TaxID=47253 RepID=A0A2W4WB26_9CYAN|nr:MAG: hypothetical protein DCF25_08110 [Leptolyngbya foveolarum]